MLFPLQNIEAHVNDRFLIIGETLYEQGKVVDLMETERHLWLATVVNNEVEIQITPTKVRAVTCECKHYEAEGICEHITAVLLKLRSEKSKIQSSKKTKKKRTSSIAKKLTTSVILQYISNEELKAFVKDYAKTNKQFGLALKARFAVAVPMADDREKYYQLIDTTVKSSRTRNDRILYAGKLKLIKIIKELLAQTEDYVATENFTDAFYILQAIIVKCAPLYTKIEGENEKYFTVVKQAFDQLTHLLKANPAPVMQDEILDFCLEQVPKTVYTFGGFTSFFFEILLKLAEEKSKLGRISAAIDDQLAQGKLQGQNKANLLITKLNLLDKKGDAVAAEKLVFENLQEPQLMLFVTARAMENGNNGRVRFLAEQGLESDFPNTIKSKLEAYLFDLAIQENNVPEIKKYGRKSLLKAKKIEDYEILKKACTSEEWADYIEEILLDLEKQSYSLEKRDIIAEILAREERFEDLFAFIIQIRSLDLLQRYDERLICINKVPVYTLYEDILNSHIRHHIGRQSSEKIRVALQHLHQIGARKLADKITEKLRINYPERFTLIEELSRL